MTTILMDWAMSFRSAIQSYSARKGSFGGPVLAAIYALCMCRREDFPEGRPASQNRSEATVIAPKG